MEPQPPPSSTPPPPPAPPPPPPSSPLPNADVLVCPVCREPRAEDARFCEECGHDYGGEAPRPVEEERSLFSGPVLWAVMLFWVALAIVGLFFLYNALWSL